MSGFIQFFFGVILAFVPLPYALYLTDKDPFDGDGNAGLIGVASIVTVIGVFIFLAA